MKNKIILVSTAIMLFCSCGNKKSGPDEQSGKVTGNINIDGSSTVYPITEAVAEEFKQHSPDVKVSAGLSGTGGGFKKFGRGEIDINDASRPIKGSEDSLCKASNISYVELIIAHDGLAVVINKENDWCKDISIQELKKLWEPGAQGKITKWSQIRAGWPDQDIHLYGPGVESGTFDYFTEAVTGKAKSSRGDYTASEDDNVLVQGIKSDKYALGFFGLAYYEENSESLKLVGVDNGNGPVLPSDETVKNKSYAPLGRPLFIYISSKAAIRPEVQAFVNFYLSNVKSLAKEVGYVSLTDDEIKSQQEKFAAYLKSISTK